MSTSISLYDRAAAIDDALATLEAAESTEERELALAKVEEAAAELLAKVDRFTAYLAHLENIEAFADAEIKRLQQRAKQARSRREHLEQYAVHVMQSHGWQVMDGETSALKLRQNPPAVVIRDEAALPAEFVRVTQTSAPDKLAIKAALKSGREVAGAALESKITLRRS